MAAPLPYLTSSFAELAAAGAGLAAHYAAQAAPVRAALLVHAVAGGLALLLTPVQGWARLRRARPRVHRSTGLLLVASILVASASGLVIAQFGYSGMVGRVGFSALALLWAFSGVRAVRAAVAGRIAEHRDWTVRTMALSFAAVTLRAWIGLLVVVQQPDTAAAGQAAFDRVYPLMPFLCWVPNLLVAEWVIRRRAGRRLRAGRRRRAEGQPLRPAA